MVGMVKMVVMVEMVWMVEMVEMVEMVVMFAWLTFTSCGESKAVLAPGGPDGVRPHHGEDAVTVQVALEGQVAEGRDQEVGRQLTHIAH